ncbi:MAG: GNAT family N-acetyltransferase [Gorillibacterium sp.]|nr:GNAT family N-acetyltransferase [Gorillibacterium sp.]
MKSSHEIVNPVVFAEVYQLMQASFPPIEFRTYAGQRALLDNPLYRLITEVDDRGKVVAFLAGWSFPGFRFVEHFAVAPQMRGVGLGSTMMRRYSGIDQKPILLEVELPDTVLAKRRIGFYQRLGFHLLAYDYVQPSLRVGQAELALRMMSYPYPINEAEFASFKRILYKEVYRTAVVSVK